MTNVTINDTLVKSRVDSSDFFPVWDTGVSEQKKIVVASIAEAVGIPHPGFISGRLYLPHYASDTSSTYAFTVGTRNLAVTPFWCPRASGFSELNANVSVAGSLMSLGVYKMGSPGQFSLLTQGEISVSTTGAKTFSFFGGILLSPGWYGLASHVNANTTIFAFDTTQKNFLFGNATVAGSNLTANTGMHFSANVAYAPLPNSLSFVSVTAGVVPAIWLRAQ
ncbi:MAG: hypothetical protein KME29_04780 [Calothrix sp. FI2-JRJ7]|jgi:hypothetical protein|nr:hypothetical protein [Calothrix sp. FI2-JRJ7]